MYDVGIILCNVPDVTNRTLALLYRLDLNYRSSNESSATVNKLTGRKLFKQLKFNRLTNTRNQEPSRIPGGECFFH